MQLSARIKSISIKKYSTINKDVMYIYIYIYIYADKRLLAAKEHGMSEGQCMRSGSKTTEGVVLPGAEGGIEPDLTMLSSAATSMEKGALCGCELQKHAL